MHRFRVLSTAAYSRQSCFVNQATTPDFYLMVVSPFLPGQQEKASRREYWTSKTWVVYINTEGQRKVNGLVGQLAIKISLECPIMQSYYTSQLNTPFLLIFWQNLDVDVTKASETVQVRKFISSNYIVLSLMPCGIFLLRIMLLGTQLISFFWSCFLNSNKQRVG